MILAIMNLYVALMFSISSIKLTVWEEMSFEEFQDGHQGNHLGYRNETTLAILNLYVAPLLPSSFGSIRHKVWEKSFEEFQDGHLGYRKEKILAILNLYVALMPPAKFWLNLT